MRAGRGAVRERQLRRQGVDYPRDRRYSATHEWHKLDGDTCTIGITKYAADELTDITRKSPPTTIDDGLDIHSATTRTIILMSVTPF